jgi:hypothetical protein
MGRYELALGKKSIRRRSPNLLDDFTQDELVEPIEFRRRNNLPTMPEFIPRSTRSTRSKYNTAFLSSRKAS